MPEGVADAEARHTQHLAEVSRSFAACIGKLQAPLRQWVGLAYLIARILDTVEDAPWPDPSAQARHFADVERFVAQSAAPGAVARWAAGLPQAITPGERRLLADAPTLFAEMHALPQGPRADLAAALGRMARGMAHYAKTRDAAGAVRLRNLGDVNRYCFVVAGVVGQLLTELLQHANPSFVASASMHLDAVHFGLFLQKVNLLKDQSHDETEGRHWLPNRAHVLASLHRNAQGAGRYLLGIPAGAHNFRLFCASSLLLGAHSLSHDENPGAAALQPKLPRGQTAALFDALAQLVNSDDALREALAEALHQLPAGTPAPGAGHTGSLSAAAYAEWRNVLGPTPLDYASAQALGMA